MLVSASVCIVLLGFEGTEKVSNGCALMLHTGGCRVVHLSLAKAVVMLEDRFPKIVLSGQLLV